MFAAPIGYANLEVKKPRHTINRMGILARLTFSQQIKTKNYHVRHYKGSPKTLIISFSSAGHAGAGEPIQEFMGTLSKIGVSSAFVTDRPCRWWNHHDTWDVFYKVAEICNEYENIGVIGDSMGASGAILFTNFYNKIDRVLGFNPQYSLCKPFIQFDDRFSSISDMIDFHYFHDFSQTPMKEKIQLMYGNADWRDYIHRAMYDAKGFSTTTVDGSAHDVARYLKHGHSKNMLLSLIQRFCDFTRPFDSQAISEGLSEILSDVPLLPAFAFVGENTLRKQHDTKPRPQEALYADSDDAASLFRDHAARHSDLMPPPLAASSLGNIWL